LYSSRTQFRKNTELAGIKLKVKTSAHLNYGT
jgi:hypothetical protein